MPSSKRRNVVLVGDSDIARWPQHVYPCLAGVAEPIDAHGNDLVSGHSGATLGEIVPKVQEMLERVSSSSANNEVVWVLCAGENDVGQGLPLEASVKALQQVLDAVFPKSSRTDNTDQPSHYLIFLGPKYEPWLNDSPDSKKAYSAMDRAFQRCCREHPSASHIHYIDCLVMFCGDTANIPGARLGGKAVAQEEFFDSDRLHLNDNGYEMWKDVVEQMIQQECLEV